MSVAPIDLTPVVPPVRTLTAADLDGLVEELAAYHAHFAPLFRRPERRGWAARYLRGLLTADVPRKNVEALALRLLGAGPGADRHVRAMQQFVGEGGWDDAAILAAHRRLVDETPGEADGVLIVDGHETPKSAACAGRSRPASPSAGRSWGWTPTRCAPGVAGTTISPASSSPTTSWSGCSGGSTRGRGAVPAAPVPLPPGEAHPLAYWQALRPPRPAGLSVAEVRVLLRALLPLPAFDPGAALARVAYQQRRKLAAYRSHRRRRLRRLAGRST